MTRKKARTAGPRSGRKPAFPSAYETTRVLNPCLSIPEFVNSPGGILEYIVFSLQTEYFR